jgi:ATP-binding cassette subfamily B protein
MALEGNGNARLRAFVAATLRQRWRILSVAFLSLLGAIAMDLIAPWPLKIIVDHVLLDKPLPGYLSGLQPLMSTGSTSILVVLCGSIAVIALLAGFFAYLQSYLSARVGYELVYNLRRELFAHLQRLSLAFHSRTRSGELLTKVASDTNLIRDALADWALKFVAESLLLVGVMIVMFAMNWQLALVVLATLPLLFVVLMRMNRAITLSARAQRKQEGRIASRLYEVLSSISLVQAFGRESYEQARFDMESAQSLEAGVRNARVAAGVSKAVGLVSALGMAGTVFFGALLALKGKVTPGELLIFVAYVNALYKPVKDLGKIWAKFSRARASAERIADILDFEQDMLDRPDAIPMRNPRGEIVFENVTFGYEGGAPVLDRVNVRIAPGEHVAMIGHSGAGKSTLVSLMLRLYQPQDGSIMIDGQDLQGYTHDTLRQAIGIVLQDNILVGASIKENIAYGKPDASAEEIEQAARLANAHEFILALPDGYDAVVGERGCTLSGGQRQRVCLARTLIKQPPILILDEPTSAVDPASAALIDRTISTTQHGKTTIVIGHQFASFDRYDRVLELREGKVIDVTARMRDSDALRMREGSELPRLRGVNGGKATA